MNRHLNVVLLASACALAFGTARAQTAAAQTSTAGVATDTQAADQLSEVVITGSRIDRPGFTSPTPVTTVSSADIAASGVTDIADLLNQVPSTRPVNTTTSADDRNSSPGLAYADLRGLGANRTLVLVNGERLVPQVGSFSTIPTQHANDMNVLPTIAIQDVNIVTGGASAAWGSDALAGVVSLQLYRHYDGFKLDASGGVSQYGDNQTQDVGMLAGRSFFDDRAHVVVALAYDHNGGIGNMFTRPWGASAYSVLLNPACNLCYLAGTGYQWSSFAPGGLITNTTLKGAAFGPNGQPYAFPYGNFISGTSEFGGSVPGNYPQAQTIMEVPQRRVTSYGYFDYKLTDRVTAHVTVNVADALVSIIDPYPTQAYTILSGNPYIPASIQAAMTAGKIASIGVGVFWSNIGNETETTDTRTTQAEIGFDWDIGHSWKADAHYSHGVNSDRQLYQPLFNLVNATQAANAVLQNGSIVCANPANGCVPLDIFGPGTASPAALNFVQQNGFTHIHYLMDDVAVNLHGEPLTLWAGPISVAAGGEYRGESQSDLADAAENANADFKEANINFSGSDNVREAYIETLVPLAKGLPFIKELDFNAADREAKYSIISQAANTWKLGATWNVTDDLLFRGTYSRDFRAPNLTELNYPRTTSLATTVIPGQTQLATTTTGGNPNLLPEFAFSTVAGFTYRPHFVPGLSASIDTFRIDLHQVIANVNAATLLTSCQLGIPYACNLETKVNGIVTNINLTFANLSSITDRGTDIELDYTSPLAELGLPGSVNLRALGTYTDTLTYEVVPGYPPINYAGQNWVGVAVNTQYYAPRFKGSFSAGYNLDQFSGTLVANYQSPSVIDKTLTLAQYPTNHLSAYIEWDLLTSYNFGNRNQFQVYGTINNLFNVAPPLGGGVTIPVNAAAYDTIGRTFKVGVRWFAH